MEGAQLIFYQRSDEPAVRQSSVYLWWIDDAVSVKHVLPEALGVQGSVEKVREVFLGTVWKCTSMRSRISEISSKWRWSWTRKGTWQQGRNEWKV